MYLVLTTRFLAILFIWFVVLLLNFVIRDSSYQKYVDSLFYNLYISQYFARRNKESIAPNKWVLFFFSFLFESNSMKIVIMKKTKHREY